MEYVVKLIPGKVYHLERKTSRKSNDSLSPFLARDTSVQIPRNNNDEVSSEGYDSG